MEKNRLWYAYVERTLYSQELMELILNYHSFKRHFGMDMCIFKATQVLIASAYCEEVELRHRKLLNMT